MKTALILRIIIRGFIFLLVICSSSAIAQTSSDTEEYIDNFKNNKNQQILYGAVENHTIVLEPVKFELISGQVTIFDFGLEKKSAMIYRGNARITFAPSDINEQYQLKRFTGKNYFNRNLDSLCIFFNDEDIINIDYFSFQEMVPDKDIWEQFKSAWNHSFSHVGIFIPNRVIGGLLCDESVPFLYADMYVKNMGRFAYEYNPYKNDIHNLYKLIMINGSETYDIYSSFSLENNLVSQREIIPVDITDYEIHSTIDKDGKMRVKCDLYYSALKSGSRYLYFNWYKGNSIISALDSNGDSLEVLEYSESFKVMANQYSEAGFGIILNHPLIEGQADHIIIEYDCNSIYNYYNLPYTIGNDCWYPMNQMRDPAAFHLTYNYPTNLQVVSSGEQMQYGFGDNGGLFSIWHLNYPSCDISFNIGFYYPIELYFENMPPVKIFTHSPVNVPTVAADMVNSLAYYNELFGKCAFDTIRVADTPGQVAESSPGLENVSWYMFKDNSYEGPVRMANQWWHHLMRYESYRDSWIAEGLAHYCALVFYEKSKQREMSFEDMMSDCQKTIFYGVGKGSQGHKAGPVVLGKRLNSSKSNDYEAVAGYKGAYIFHMIRYMLHDFKTGSDDLFIEILNKLLTEYSTKPITTDRLKTLLEQYLGDMTWFFDQWVYGMEIPTYKFSHKTKKSENGKYLVTCKVIQSDVPDEFKMIVPITINFGNEKYTHHKLLINKTTNEIELPPLPLEPKDIDFNTYDAVLCKTK